MLLRKTLAILLVAMLAVMAGCSSTNPTLKDVWLEGQRLNQDSFESRVTLTFSTDFPADQLSEEAQLLLQILESGIVLDMKQQDATHMYGKMQLSNPDFLREQNLWELEQDPNLEFYLADSEIYFKTSSEDKWIKGDFMAATVAAPGQVSVFPFENQEEIQEFVMASLEDYLEQFDYELRDIEDMGTAYVDTPDGEKKTRHIRVSLNFEDITNFLSYLLGNLAEYEKLDDFFMQLYQLVDGQGTEELTEEEMAANIEQFRTDLLKMKRTIDLQLNKQMIAMMTGMEPDLEVNLDYYVDRNARIYKQVTDVKLTLNPVAEDEMAMMSTEMSIEQPVQIQFSAETLTWNQHQDVEITLPEGEETLLMEEVFASRSSLKQLNEDSFLRQFGEKVMFPRRGVLQIGSRHAEISNRPVQLDAAPYVVGEGHTMVPVRQIAWIAGTEPEWNPDTREVTFEVDGKVLVVQIGNRTAMLNGQPVEMPVAPEIKNSRSFVPLRFILENLGATVDYEPQTRSITIEFPE
ncbi:MAG: copper amine oxidase N-terminal domain-containing protein [Bacillaceae bacterium]|nr:copper amine oxidase N-terminal domain-containing protein [Bacillaceae bacterium]